jgi:REP element-mobilizing transposase RayT
MFSQPIAYFLTWSCYGTRLHGDERGSVDRSHNQFGEATLPADPHRLKRERELMTYPPFVLGALERTIVEGAINDHALHRKWRIHALNVRTTHMHVVIASVNYSPEETLDQLKSWSTRRLRTAGLLAKDAPAWSTHGSTVYVWNEDGLYETKNYVLNRQGDELSPSEPSGASRRSPESPPANSPHS